MTDEVTDTTKTSIMGELKSAPKPVDAPIQVETSSPEWYLAENVPGVGARPDYLSPKYKTMAEQAKAYNELHKTIVNTQGAPEQYDISEYDKYVKADDPHMQKLMSFSKQNRFSQEAFKEIVGTLVEYEKAKAPNIDKEIERLGPDGAKKIETVQRWAENTFSQAALDTLGKITTNAEVINLLDEFRQYTHVHAVSVPGSNQAGESFTRLSVAEVEAEMHSNYGKYTSDPRYRAEIQAKFRQAVGEE